MITQFEANTLLKEILPAPVLENYPSRPSLEIYASMIHFTDLIKQVLQVHDFAKAKKYFAMAEELYKNVDKMVRLLIEDSFIYSITSIMQRSSSDMFMVKAILPDTLYKLYKKQLSKENKDQSTN